MTPRLRKGDLIAVYGLLRPGGGAVEKLGLSRTLAPVGPCRIPGAIVDLGAYPGLVDEKGEARGDLLRVVDPACGPVLDTFEDFLPAAPRRSRYLRLRRRMAAPRVWAWVYVWNRAYDRAPVIADGDWLAHVARRS